VDWLNDVNSRRVAAAMLSIVEDFGAPSLPNGLLHTYSASRLKAASPGLVMHLCSASWTCAKP